MVMNVLRRKKRNPLLLILLGAVALSFVIFFGTGLSGRRKKGGIGPDAVAVVNGYQIDHRTFENQMRHERPRIERQMEQLRRLITDEDALREQEAQVIKRARLSALENLIDRTLIDQAAQQYDVRGSDNEVRTRIMSDPNFQSGGKFDPNLYRDILGHNRIAPEFYEEDIRHFVSMGRLHSMVTGSVVITDTEVRQEYDRRNDKLSLEYITLDSQAYTEDVEVTPAEVRAYFEQHPEKFISVSYTHLTLPTN